MLWGENRGKWKGRQLPGVEPRTTLAAWAASALPLSHFPLFSSHNIQTHLFPAWGKMERLEWENYSAWVLSWWRKLCSATRFSNIWLTMIINHAWGWILPSALSQCKLQLFVRPQQMTTQRRCLCRHKTNFSYQTPIPGWFVNCKWKHSYNAISFLQNSTILHEYFLSVTACHMALLQ